MKINTIGALASSGLLAIIAAAGAQTAHAQGASDSKFELEEIVVTARRKDESLQDVPTTINAVTGEEIQKLNIRKFEDIASVVPGLQMASNANGIGATASVRGINYDVNASGNNGTVEFYLNDAPISAGNLFQSVYDIQQVELLRGPQGTLRGRASPSGSMTVTTRRPDLNNMGGYASGTANNIGGWNTQGAFNIPVVSSMLAVRVAASYDKSESNGVVSLNNSADPSSKTKSGRVTVRFEPTDSLSFILTAQKTKQEVVNFNGVESQQVINPGAATGGAPGASYALPFITASQRLSVEDAPRTFTQDFNNYNFQAQWAFAGQKLNYVGARNEQDTVSGGTDDLGDFFPANYPAFTKGFGQTTHGSAYTTAHELRLSNEERVFDMFDYIVGAFTQRANFPTDLSRSTVVLFGAPSPTVAGTVVKTPIGRTGGNKEQSGFFNLTAHLGDATEVSAGARYIKYHSEGALFISGARQALADEDSDFHTTIYTASVKQNFSDDMMAYFTVGSSWRPGISATGDFSLSQTALERSFVVLEPEKSTSFELGFKATALDKRLRYSASVYHQKFDNYPYRSSSGVFFAETAPTGPRVGTFNFVAAVPVEVNGLEADVAFAPISSWEVGASGAYAKGEIKDGFIPCNDYNPRDGVPDTAGLPPGYTFNDIRTAAGDNLSGCNVSQRASNAPQVSGTVTSEYRLPITATMNGYVRGLVSLYGASKNDPTNPVDDYSGYQLLNLYLGVRSADGAWEASLYGKNVTNTERVLARGNTPAITSYNIGATGFQGGTNYYGGASGNGGLVLTPQREFGISLRYAFGSR